MALKLYNTLSKKIEPFTPQDKGKVKLYTCGPTVYLFAHIGNFATYIREDVLRRFLEYSGYEVRHIMNITDVGHLTSDADSGEDKMVKSAKAEKKTPTQIAEFYTRRFLADAGKLHLEPAHKYPRATAHIKEIIDLIKTLIAKGFAYEANGNVFFDIAKFKDYGKLSGQTPDKITTGVRLEAHPDKKHPGDFALWLKAPKNHLMQWDSPWGRGYPGWHIECSAMSMKYLDTTLDIHASAEDHIFSHHENEFAQTEDATGQPFARYWLHSYFLLIDGNKMSKSKGNIYTLADLEEKGYDPLVYRFFIFSGHYRSRLNFTWEALDDARAKLNRLIEFKERLEKITDAGEVSPEVIKLVEQTEESFRESLDDDLNTPKALDAVFELAKNGNRLADADQLTKADTENILTLLRRLDKVMAFLDYHPKTAKISETEIKKLVGEREQARAKKDFAAADKIRQKLFNKGIEIKDEAKGTEWKIK